MDQLSAMDASFLYIEAPTMPQHVLGVMLFDAAGSEGGFTVERFRALGGRNVTVGSDAHRADAFAFGLEEGYRILARAEFEELTFRRGGSRVAVALPQRIPS